MGISNTIYESLVLYPMMSHSLILKHIKTLYKRKLQQFNHSLQEQEISMRRLILNTVLLLCIALAKAGDSKLNNWLENLDITPEMIDQLTSENKTVVTATVSEVLRKQLAKKDISLDISPEEARFSQNLPNQCQDQTSCGCRLESRDVKVHAAIKRSSSFSKSNKLFKDDGIFLGMLTSVFSF